MTNKELIERYPFLTPRNVWTGKLDENYNYEFTMLDDMPDGWRNAFGEQMCEEIRDALLKAQEENPDGGYEDIEGNIIPYLYGYYPTQIKSKYAELRWYDNGAPQEVHDIIAKYEHKSRFICEFCGKPAKWISNGWIDPFCDECAHDTFDKKELFVKEHYSSYTPGNFEENFTKIEEFYK